MKYLKKYNQVFEDKNTPNKKHYINMINIILIFSDEKSYSSGDLELDNDEVFYDNDDSIALIDNYMVKSFGYTIYGGYKKETVLDSGVSNYIDLDVDILSNIYDNLCSGYDNEKISYDNLLKKVNMKNFHDLEKLYNILPSLKNKYYINFDFGFDHLYRHMIANEFNI